MATDALPQQPANGVFKGGGAKGIAYAGALLAVEGRYELRSVAGASAGAVTATLIAAGYGAEELAGLTGQALASVRAIGAHTLIAGRARSLFNNARLATFLEEALRRKLDLQSGGPDTSPLTFRELFECNAVGLYVVTLDLATGHPRVFHHLATPHISVAAAVVASSAIPGAFAPGRLVVGREGRHVNQVIDGGAWANFPLFVYTDRAFREWFEAGIDFASAPSGSEESFHAEVSEDRTTLGFLLTDREDEVEDPAAAFLVTTEKRFARLDGGSHGSGSISPRFDRGPSETTGSLAQYVLARLLGGPGRVVALVGTVLWVAATIRWWPYAIRELNTFLVQFPPLLFALISTVLGLAVAVLVVGVLCGTIAVFLLGRVLADTVLPAGRASLGVATGTTPWVRASPSCTILRVPASGVGTTQFRVPPDIVRHVVSVARASVTHQLGGPAPEATAGPQRASQAILLRFRRWCIPYTVLVILAAGVGWLMRAVAGGPWTPLIVMLMAVVLVYPLYACTVATWRAWVRSESPVGRSGVARADVRAAWPYALIGAALLLVGAIILLDNAGRDYKHLARATVLVGVQVPKQRVAPAPEVQLAGTSPTGQQIKDCERFEQKVLNGSGYRYEFRVEWAASEVPEAARARNYFYSKSPLPVGQTLLVRNRGACWSLADKAGVAQSILPVLLFVAGSSGLAAADGRRRWRTRNRRLATAAAWT